MNTTIMYMIWHAMYFVIMNIWLGVWLINGNVKALYAASVATFLFIVYTYKAMKGN